MVCPSYGWGVTRGSQGGRQGQPGAGGGEADHEAGSDVCCGRTCEPLLEEADRLKGERAERRVCPETRSAEHDTWGRVEAVVQTEPGEQAEQEAAADIDDQRSP